MKYKQKIDSAVALITLFISLFVILCPKLHITNNKTILISFFFLLGLINGIQYCLTIKEKDIEGLGTCAISFITTSLLILWDVDVNVQRLALSLMLWTTGMSLIKLKKIDYYHDRQDRMWKLKTFSLLLFILAGILTCIYLNYEEEIQIILIGYYFFIHAILELLEPIIKTLIKHS